MAQSLEIVSHSFRDFVLLPFTSAATGNVTQTGFVASRVYNIGPVTQRWQAASSSGTMNVTLEGSGAAPGTGTNVLVSPNQLTSLGVINNISQLLPVIPNMQLQIGQSLSVTMAGTITNLVGLVVTISLQPVGV